MLNMEFGDSVNITFSAIVWLNSNYPVVLSGGGNRSTQGKTLPNPKSLADIFSHVPSMMRTQAVVRDG